MARRRQTASGAPAQPATPVAGQTYGLGVEQQRMQEAMPLPNTHAPQRLARGRDGEHAGMAGQDAQQGSTMDPSVAEHFGMNGQAGTPTNADDGRLASYQQALESAKGLSGDVGLLSLPTQRPGEPVTHGLSTGPGGGPSALGLVPGSPTGRWMRKLAAESGNPYLQQLADRIRA